MGIPLRGKTQFLVDFKLGNNPNVSGIIQLEAEDVVISGNYEVNDDISASGEQYISAPLTSKKLNGSRR
jgi:hypothetical protein